MGTLSLLELQKAKAFRHETQEPFKGRVWTTSHLMPYSSHFTSITVTLISFYLFIQKNRSVEVSVDWICENVLYVQFNKCVSLFILDCFLFSSAYVQ